MAVETEKNVEVSQADTVNKQKLQTPADDAVVTGFEADEADLPKGYFRSRFFLGSYLAIALGLWGGTAAL
jgi:hypothetical protein